MIDVRMSCRCATDAAIRRGELIRKPCIKCGAKAHAHHRDYANHLDIEWLCLEHHMEEHRRLRSAGIEINGSPGRPKEQPFKMLQFRVDAKTYEQIAAAATRDSRTVSSFIRALIAKALIRG